MSKERESRCDICGKTMHPFALLSHLMFAHDKRTYGGIDRAKDESDFTVTQSYHWYEEAAEIERAHFDRLMGKRKHPETPAACAEAEKGATPEQIEADNAAFLRSFGVRP